MVDPRRYFTDLTPSARSRLVRKLEKPEADGLVNSENRVIREHLRPALQQMRPERVRQAARVALRPAEPFMVDSTPPEKLPLIPRTILAPLVRHLAASNIAVEAAGGAPAAIDWGAPFPNDEDKEEALQEAVARSLSGAARPLTNGIAKETGCPVAVVDAAIRTIVLCLSHAETVEEWERNLPPYPILWVDMPMVERIFEAYTEAGRSEKGLGRLFLILVMRRLQDASQLKTAMAAARNLPAGLAEEVKRDMGDMLRHCAQDEIAGLEKALTADSLAAIDFFRVTRALNALQAAEGSSEEGARRVGALLGKVTSGTLTKDVTDLLEDIEGVEAAEEVERSLREIGALARSGLLPSLEGPVSGLADMIQGRLVPSPGGEPPDRRQTMYGLHLLELVSGSDRADLLRRQIVPPRPRPVG